LIVRAGSGYAKVVRSWRIDSLGSVRVPRVMSWLVLATAVSLAMAPESKADREAAWTPGMHFADGTNERAPSPTVWGAAPAIDPRSASRALVELRRDFGAIWISWDESRQTAAGIMFARVGAPGSTSTASRAEDFARAMLAEHVAAFARGAAPSDFDIVANDLSAGIRTIGMTQRYAGIPVEGGQISFRFVDDHLVHTASQALPDVEVTLTDAPVAPTTASRAAMQWIERELGFGAMVTDTPRRTILPRWHADGWHYHDTLAIDVRLSDGEPGHWIVYLDAATGEPVARKQMVSTAANVRFEVPIRHPGTGRYAAVAPQLNVLQGGANATTDDVGDVTLSNSPTQVVTGVQGPLVRVLNEAGDEVSASFDVTDGDAITWSLADEFGDAQLSGFIHAGLAKEFVRAIDPDLDFLDDQFQVHVNLNGSCNAVSDGNDIYFLSGGQCQNTARIADVVYHEAGHSVHRAAIIPGVGAMESALSEGISDYLAATMVDDSGMGRGFFNNNDPLRELDPMGSEWTWPMDKGESHAEGRIIGGTLWDLRIAMQEQQGIDEGQQIVDNFWYQSIRRATDIPSMYAEVLVADDDDGSIANGTPNACLITEVFGLHGLVDPSQLGDVTIDLEQTKDGRQVILAQSLPAFDDCPFPEGAATLQWRIRETPDDVTTEAMVVQDGTWVATIPEQATGVVVEYRVLMDYGEGTLVSFPRNAADPWAQLFFGAAQPIYCLDETYEPSNWAFGGSGGTWSYGPLVDLGDGLGVDPSEPYDDDGVLLSQDGIYPPFANTTATGPVVDVEGRGDVRLHYQRWLTVEDAFFDDATIRANGEVVWSNLETAQANVHHVDRQWRFHDIPLADVITDGTVQLQFGLQSDGGLHMGGWTVDALCIVEIVEQVCGDDVVTGDEECDDGNTEPGDGCDEVCHDEPIDPTGEDTTGGDDDGTTGGADTTGGGDDGPMTTTTPMTSATTDPTNADGSSEDSTGGAGADASDGGCGCDAGRTRDRGAAWMLVGVVAMLRARRRRAA
jgi:cysteine-rich repeat protein